MRRDVGRVSEQLAEWLTRMEIDADRGDEGITFLKFGSTAVMISVFEDDGHAFVRLASTVLAGVTPKVELLTRLLRLNAEVLVGSFVLFDDHTLAFTSTLLADELDYDGFAWALTYVARVGDDNDEELQALAGGFRVEDLLDGEVG